jgi:hypothetical protein
VRNQITEDDTTNIGNINHQLSSNKFIKLLSILSSINPTIFILSSMVIIYGLFLIYGLYYSFYG